MEKVQVITGTVAPLDVSDVDTDQISPAHWMKRVERTGYENALFEKHRLKPDFVLNQPERQGATVLVSGPNFGCGSSREHAPWALRDYGFKAVVAPSFGDIFRNNLPNVGLVPVQLDEANCKKIMDATINDASTLVTINILNCTISCEQAEVDGVKFFLEENAAFRLANGLDLIDSALQFDEQITVHEKNRPFWMPKASQEIETPFAPWLEE